MRICSGRCEGWTGSVQASSCHSREGGNPGQIRVIPAKAGIQGKFVSFPRRRESKASGFLRWEDGSLGSPPSRGRHIGGDPGCAFASEIHPFNPAHHSRAVCFSTDSASGSPFHSAEKYDLACLLVTCGGT